MVFLHHRQKGKEFSRFSRLGNQGRQWTTMDGNSCHVVSPRAFCSKGGEISYERQKRKLSKSSLRPHFRAFSSWIRSKKGRKWPKKGRKWIRAFCVIYLLLTSSAIMHFHSRYIKNTYRPWNFIFLTYAKTTKIVTILL